MRSLFSHVDRLGVGEYRSARPRPSSQCPQLRNHAPLVEPFDAKTTRRDHGKRSRLHWHCTRRRRRFALHRDRTQLRRRLRRPARRRCNPPAHRRLRHGQLLHHAAIRPPEAICRRAYFAAHSCHRCGNNTRFGGVRFRASASHARNSSNSWSILTSDDNQGAPSGRSDHYGPGLRRSHQQHHRGKLISPTARNDYPLRKRKSVASILTTLGSNKNGLSVGVLSTRDRTTGSGSELPAECAST
jgi:hypothetical protein